MPTDTPVDALLRSESGLSVFAERYVGAATKADREDLAEEYGLTLNQSYNLAAQVAGRSPLRRLLHRIADAARVR